MKKLAFSLSLLAAAAGVSAQTITFDDVPFSQFRPSYGGGYQLSNLTSYAGLSWSDQFRQLRATGTPPPGTPLNNGFANGLVSGEFVAFNGGAAPVSFEALTADGLFNFDSAYLGAAWYSSLSVAVQGFRDGVQQYSTTINGLSFVDSVLINFGWTNIDRVSFTSVETGSAGTTVDSLSTYNRAFVMDNLSVSAVPEPETYAMLLAGLGLMGAIARRRKHRAV